jgi:hypothetical protein
LRERDLAQAGEIVAALALSVGCGHQRTIRVSPRLLAATMPTIAIKTMAPIAIQSHGTLLVLVSVVVDFSVVVPVEAFGAVADEPPVVAGPVVVVVDWPLLFVVCASVIAGAMARNSANSIRLSRKIGRM